MNDELWHLTSCISATENDIYEIEQAIKALHEELEKKYDDLGIFNRAFLKERLRLGVLKTQGGSI